MPPFVVISATRLSSANFLFCLPHNPCVIPARPLVIPDLIGDPESLQNAECAEEKEEAPTKTSQNSSNSAVQKETASGAR